MGNSCFESCLREQVKKDKSFIVDTEIGKVLTTTQNVYQKNQIVFSNTVLRIESKSIADIQIDTLVIFVDKPEAVMKNQFIKKLGVSVMTILEEKIRISMNANKRDKQFRLRIADPFYGVNIRRLVISQVKVWDGITHHDRYLKNIIESQIINLTKNVTRTSIAIMELQSDLGYNLKDFYKILMRKLKQYRNKINDIVYVTYKREQIGEFLSNSDFPSMLETESNISETSNYY